MYGKADAPSQIWKALSYWIMDFSLYLSQIVAMFWDVSSIFQMLNSLSWSFIQRLQAKEIEKMFHWNIHNCDTEMRWNIHTEAMQKYSSWKAAICGKVYSSLHKDQTF